MPMECSKKSNSNGCTGTRMVFYVGPSVKLPNGKN